MTPRRGLVFRHTRFLDPSFVPGPGQKHSDAPKALCRVTGVRGDIVYYAIGENAPRGRYQASMEKFLSDVCGEVIS